jgi:hypothetical protein
LPKSRTNFAAIISAARHQQEEPSAEPAASVAPVEIPEETRDAPARYLTLAVKTVRLRPDQRENLTLLARRLSRAKKGGERITDDTLIRVAVDVLLRESDKLEGRSEEELLTAYSELLKI